MTREGLIEALRRKATDDVEGLWRDTHAEGDALRAAAKQEVESERAALAAQTAAAGRRAALAGHAAAERKARDEHMRVVGELGERLYALARDELRTLGAQGAEALLTALAAELPSYEWQRVRVRPADVSVAQRLFPNAAVEGEPAIAGGLSAEADQGRVEVDNTLEARLDSAWPDLLPELVRDIMKEASDGRAAA